MAGFIKSLGQILVNRIKNLFSSTYSDQPSKTPNNSSLQCYSVLSDILVKNELCIPLERGSNVLSAGEGFICLSIPSKLKIAVRFCSIYNKTISFSAIVFLVIFVQWPMMIMSRDCVSSVAHCSIYINLFPWRNC